MAEPAEVLNDPELDAALEPPQVDHAPGEAYAARHRRFQGIPTLERTGGGRLWAAWYTGGTGEGSDNHVILVRSDDDGRSWSEPMLAIDPSGRVRAFDPCLWLDPDGRLWLLWAQSFTHYDGRCGTWAIVGEQPEAANAAWSRPRRLCDGITMNKPTVLRDGTWLLPAAIWGHHRLKRDDMAPLRHANVYASTDRGASWTRRGGVDMPERNCDEHMIVELGDGRLWMLVRTAYGIGQSFSSDGGYTWTDGEDSNLPGPNSRFYIRRLKSGRLLLVTHVDFHQREGKQRRCNLAAMISGDDGRSWQGPLILDERPYVSYPDGAENDDGRIDIIYDRERTGDMEILLASFTERDVAAGRPVTEAAKLKQVICRAGGPGHPD